tara:strand:+ start:590 stop:1129 length:540 start_codon:yes stop_codon:yes gene_type:complete
MRFINRIGQTYYRLTAIKLSPEKSGGQLIWLCRCSCGNPNLHPVASGNWGKIQSCGCLRNEATIRRNFRHGHSFRGKVSHQYFLLMKAKERARKCKVPLEIDHNDIIIPRKCPILGINLTRSKQQQTDSSATIDRIDPKVGYVKGNIWVISQRANRIKNDASLEELQLLLKVIKGREQE